jgi:hypothetical protein
VKKGTDITSSGLSLSLRGPQLTSSEFPFLHSTNENEIEIPFAGNRPGLSFRIRPRRKERLEIAFGSALVSFHPSQTPVCAYDYHEIQPWIVSQCRAAQMLQISPYTVDGWRRCGLLRPLVIGKHVYACALDEIQRIAANRLKIGPTKAKKKEEALR